MTTTGNSFYMALFGIRGPLKALEGEILICCSFLLQDFPQLEKSTGKTSDKGSKRPKLSTDATADRLVLPESEENLDLGDNSEGKEEFETAEEKEVKSFKVRTAIPLLKMQGHTGFLTFATVPPMLKHRRNTASKLKTSTIISKTMLQTEVQSTNFPNTSTEMSAAAVETLESTTEVIK